MVLHDIDIPEATLADFCRRHRIRRLALFGSIVREDFGPDSDIDVLVEFEPGATPGLGFFAIQNDLGELLGRRVDLNTSQCLHDLFRDEVLAEARVIYDAGYGRRLLTVCFNPRDFHAVEPVH